MGWRSSVDVILNIPKVELHISTNSPIQLFLLLLSSKMNYQVFVQLVQQRSLFSLVAHEDQSPVVTFLVVCSYFFGLNQNYVLNDNLVINRAEIYDLKDGLKVFLISLLND